MKPAPINQKIFKPKIRIEYGDDYKFVQNTVSSNKLHTVCEEARCPNIFECWSRGTATIMILGDICTRACGFCSVKTGKPQLVDTMEPFRTAMAVKKMKLRHVVITSVDRDDLKADYGASIWAETIEQIHHNVPGCTVEVLTPDFQGYKPALHTVFKAGPEIFSHNVDYGLRTKTGIMLGLGETKKEVLNTMSQVIDIGVEIFTIGQYLQPTKNHLPVSRYVDEDEFKFYKQEGLRMGFTVVESGALVRSSYHADEQARLAKVV